MVVASWLRFPFFLFSSSCSMACTILSLNYDLTKARNKSSLFENAAAGLTDERSVCVLVVVAENCQGSLRQG